MTRDEARAAVLGAIAEIAPEVDPAALNPAADMRTEADLDSMDFLALVEFLAQSTGVVVPEKDYGQARSVDALADYLVCHAA